MVTATAPEVKLTVSGRPVVDTLDLVAVNAEAEARVEQVLAQARVDAEKHVAALPKIAADRAAAARAAVAKAESALVAAEKAAAAKPTVTKLADAVVKAGAALTDAREAADKAAAAAETAAIPDHPDTIAAGKRTVIEDLLTAAAHLETEAMDTLTAKEGYMYRLAFSLALYEGVRGVNRAVGIGREAFAKRMTTALDGEVRSVKVTGPDGKVKSQPIPWTKEEGAATARRHRIARYGNAIHELPKVAREVALAHAIIVRVKPPRNELILELASMGATRVYIAGIIGREPSRVSHIVTGRGR